MSKKCPISASYCIEERCQWWREYATDCAISVVVDKLIGKEKETDSVNKRLKPLKVIENMGVCPTCYKLLSAIRKGERCIGCDQLLDWSDYE